MAIGAAGPTAAQGEELPTDVVQIGIKPIVTFAKQLLNTIGKLVQTV
jgi:hypothetical protein